jgi:prophage maintenance system killer protein
MKSIKKEIKTLEAKVTRKEAFQKAGKYAAFTASTMFLLLNTKEASASPIDTMPNWP